MNTNKTNCKEISDDILKDALNTKVKYPSIWSVFKSKINITTALIAVAFGVVFVGSLSLVAYSEIASEDYTPFVETVKAKTKVLGLASYGYNTPVCNKGACLNHMLIGFQNGGWQVRIDYQLPSRIIGSIRVNGWKFMDNISGSGSGYTGYDLKPGENYRFILYRKYYSRLIRLVTLDLTAPPAPYPVCPERAAPPEGCYYDFSFNSCGNLICPPAYGYSIVNVGPVSQNSWREGWIENVSYPNNIYEPGSLKIGGWVYDEGKYPTVEMKLYNQNNGSYYSYSYQEVYSLSNRQDVVNYINKQIGNTTGSVTGIFYFSTKFDNLPAGSYIISNARYNGYLFNNAHYGPHTFYSQPSYGYAGVLGIHRNDNAPYQSTVSPSSNDNTLFNIALNNTGSYVFGVYDLNFEANTEQVIQNITPYLVDENNVVVAKLNYSTIIGKQFTLKFDPVLEIKGNTSRYLRFKANISATASGSISFKVSGVSYATGYTMPSRVAGMDWWSNPVTVSPSTNIQSKISITYPNGGEKLVKGTSYLIKWDSLNIANVYLKLRKNSIGDTVAVITDIIPNTGSYQWTVPTNLADGSDYVVRIISSDQKTYDDSDLPFSISSPSSAGNLSAFLDTPRPGGTITAGSFNIEVMKFVIKAEGQEASLRQINLKLSGNIPISNFSNLRLYDSQTGVLLSSFVPALQYDSVGFGITPIIIPAGSQKSFSLRIDLAKNAPSGSFYPVLTDVFVSNKIEAVATTNLPLQGDSLTVVISDPTQSTAIPRTFSARYIKIDTPSSNSWVGWREVEFYDTSGNKILSAGISASGSYSYSTPDRAFDGDINTVWNSGNYNGTITFDLGQSKNITKMRILPANYPNPAQTTHYLYISSGSGYTELTRFLGPIYDNQWLTYTP